MSATSDAILVALAQAARAWAETPEGQATIREVEQMILANLPGWEGTALRALSAFLPHHVESIGFKKDGPG